MGKNVNPRYTNVGDPTSNATLTTSGTFGLVMTTAAADFTGISANYQLCFTANSTNGSRIIGVHLEPIGTNVASVARIYVNNGATNGTAANNQLIGQVSLPTTTTSNTAAFGSSDFYFAGGALDLPASYRVYVGLGTTVAAGWVASPILGGQF